MWSLSRGGEKDDKPAKNTARAMPAMVRDERPKFTDIHIGRPTCHNGSIKPETAKLTRRDPPRHPVWRLPPGSARGQTEVRIEIEGVRVGDPGADFDGAMLVDIEIYNPKLGGLRNSERREDSAEWRHDTEDPSGTRRSLLTAAL
jgi:hypothetical protein